MSEIEKSDFTENTENSETIELKNQHNPEAQYKRKNTFHDNSSVSLSMLCFRRVLNENANSKMIVIEAEHNKETAVVILEKTPFNENDVKQILSDDDNHDADGTKRLKCDFHNDIYGNYFVYPRSQLNGIKTTIIHPATEKHLQKYSKQNVYIITETPEIYQNITLPHIESQKFSLKWVYNILDHTSESERIICEDMDPDVGFVLLPDMKWDGMSIDNFNLMAVSRKTDIRSLRDLTAQHLPLLKNMKSKICDAIKEKYDISSSSLRIFIHYQPSYYHFHVHITTLTRIDSCQTERAHLLDSVINNITLCSDYYQKISLPFVVKQSDTLFPLYRNANVLQI